MLACIFVKHSADERAVVYFKVFPFEFSVRVYHYKDFVFLRDTKDEQTFTITVGRRLGRDFGVLRGLFDYEETGTSAPTRGIFLDSGPVSTVPYVAGNI